MPGSAAAFLRRPIARRPTYSPQRKLCSDVASGSVNKLLATCLIREHTVSSESDGVCKLPSLSAQSFSETLGETAEFQCEVS